jgi:hypothetical protein
MSAQIIAALRRHADALEAAVPKVPVPVYDDRAMPSPYAHVTYEVCRVLAREFRAVADEAEGREAT